MCISAGNAVCLVYFNMKGFKSGKISYVDWCYSLYVWEEDGKINKNEKTDSSESCQKVSVQTEGLEVLEISFQNLNEGLKKGSSMKNLGGLCNYSETLILIKNIQIFTSNWAK